MYIRTGALGTPIKRRYICRPKLPTALFWKAKQFIRISSLDDECDRVIKPLRIRLEIEVAKKAAKKKITRKDYTASDIKLLKMHSKARTPVSRLGKLMKRSEGSLRQKALKLGIGLGHQR
jgi:hypothetical protein